jgi:hypothetical protein
MLYHYVAPFKIGSFHETGLQPPKNSNTSLMHNPALKLNFKIKTADQHMLFCFGFFVFFRKKNLINRNQNKVDKMGNLRFKSKPKKKSVVTRKQIRKDKRKEKKNRTTTYYQKSKEFHLKSKQAKKGNNKKEFEGKPNATEVDDDDEEIPSDFEDGPSESQPAPQKRPQISQIEKDRIAEMNEREDYDNELKRKRLEQLEEQNENEDKIIKRYEKLLKINKRKSKKEISFDDGLDYALELCTPESIQKMYAAAKDAAADDNGSEDEFKEDMEIAMGKKPSAKKTKSSVNGKKNSPVIDQNKQAKEKRQLNKLKEIEQKYFGDEIDLDGGDSLAGSDSEFEEDVEENEGSDSGEDVLEEPIKKTSGKKKKQPIEEPPSKKMKSLKEKLVSDSDNSDFDLLESGDDGDSDDEGSEDFSGDDASDSHDDSEAENVMQQLKKRKETKKVEVARNDDESDSDPEANSVWEQLKNRKKNVATEKYIPPHARKSAEAQPEEDSDPEANSVWEQLKNRKKNAATEKYIPPHARKAAEAQPEEEDSDPEANSVWEQLKNRRKNKSTVDDATTKEDIYGRKRDQQGNVVEDKSEKYVPPHVRARLEAENSDDPKRTEKLLRLQKQLKGQLNRLAETNLHRIANDIDNLYMQNARFDMNNTITNLILDAIVLENLSPDRMVLEHTLLIAILHANVGSEVGELIIFVKF